jgi:competence protein ComEC
MIADRNVVAAAVAVVVAVWSGSTVLGAACLLAAVAVTASAGGGVRSALFWCLVGALVAAGAVRSERAWSGLRPDAVGAFLGWADVVDDPQPYGASTRVILGLDGERFELWARGRALRLRVETWRAGERVMVAGERRGCHPTTPRSIADWSSATTAGSHPR